MPAKAGLVAIPAAARGAEPAAETVEQQPFRVAPAATRGDGLPHCRMKACGAALFHGASAARRRPAAINAHADARRQSPAAGRRRREMPPIGVPLRRRASRRSSRPASPVANLRAQARKAAVTDGRPIAIRERPERSRQGEMQADRGVASRRRRAPQAQPPRRPKSAATPPLRRWH